MKSTDNRRLFGTLIGASAATGNIVTIPATQGTAGDGTASIALAFPPETFIARAAGGEPPRGADMNGFLNLLSSAVQVLQAGYLGPFDATFAAGIGGYPAGAVVSGSTAGTFWVSTAEANTTVPGATGANWKSLFGGLAQLAGTNDFKGNQTFEGNVWFTGASGKNAYIYNPPAAPTTGVGGDVPNTYWVDQYYARTIALNSEAQTRAQADTALNLAKANLAGGNDFTGNQTFENAVTFTGATGFNAKITNAPAAPTTGVGGDVPNTYWVDQYYARTTALQSEAQTRAQADTALNLAKANLAGGNTFTGGDQTVTGTVVFGGYTNSQQLIAKEPTFGMIVSLKASRNNTDGTNHAILSYTDTVKSYHEWQFKPDGGIFSTTKNDSVAFRGDLPTSGTITGGTYTKTPMNDGTGRSVLRQTFSVLVSPDSSGNATVTFPIAYSVIPNVVGLGSVEMSSSNAGGIVVQRNSAGTGLLTTTTSVPIHFWFGNGSSTLPSMPTITVEGIVS